MDGTRVRTYNVMSQLSDWKRAYVHVYHGTRVLEYQKMVRVRTRVRTNITLSQKRLEIQALRCNGDTSGTRVHVYVLVYVRTYVRTYMCTNITLSQKPIVHMYVYVPRYQWYHGNGTTMVPLVEHHGTLVPARVPW